MDTKGIEIEGVAGYRPDCYYIDVILDHHMGLHRETPVSVWRFWWTYLTRPWKWRRWRRTLREKDDFYGH